MFKQLGMTVYETTRHATIGDNEVLDTRDNVCVGAILDLQIIEEQLQQLTYTVHELTEENQLAGVKQREVAKSWVAEIRTAVALLVNSRSWEI